MPVYTFDAMDSQGQSIRDEIEARSEQDAAEKIRRRGLFPTSVQSKSGKAAAVATPLAAKRTKSGFYIGGVRSKDLTMFTRQFATLMDAGLPIVRSLDILQNQQKTGLLKDTLAQVREDVEGGSSLSEALARHPKVFDKLYVNMIRAGEAGGVLDTILNRLADFREKSLKLRMQVIRAMIYPIAVIVIATGILALIVIVVIPKFQEMFEEMGPGTELPVPTQILMSITTAVVNFWYLIPLVPLGIYATFKLIAMSPQGRYTIDRLKLHIPVFGIIARKSAVSRFCRTLGTLIASGVPILEGLNIIKGATGNAVVANAVGEVHNSIREGDTIAEPLRHCGVFDDMVVNMIDVGEETGELDKMLMKVADNYDAEVDALVGGLMSLLEPFLIIGMGVTVGFIVIALFMPLISLMEKLGG